MRLRLFGLVIMSVGLACIFFGFRPTSASGSERQTWVELFGPTQNEGLLDENPVSYGAAPNVWVVPGASTSTSFKKFWFNRAWGNITWTAFRVEWRPRDTSQAIRLIDADDGVVNRQEIAEVRASDLGPGRIGNPSIGAVDITAQMRALAAAGVPKNIGWQIEGDGSAAMQVYHVYLEVLEGP